MAATTPPTKTESRPTRLLVVDDSRANRYVVVKLLEQQGYRCDQAGDGTTALEMIKKNDYSLVLMDIEMGRLDGDEAAAIVRAREDDGNSRVPIIALTSLPPSTAILRCREAEMDGILLKPVDLRALLEVVKRFVSAQPRRHRRSASSTGRPR